jgi:hypothetical protein
MASGRLERERGCGARMHGCTGEVRFDGCFVGLIKRKGSGVMWQLELRIRR